MRAQSQEFFPFASPWAMFEVAAATNRAMFHAMSVWNAEMAKFVGHRLEMDAKLQEDLARTMNPFDAFEAMTKFYETAYADYRKEGERLSDIAATTAEENLVSLEAELNPKTAPVID